MSILILNKSVCPICRKPICEGDQYYAFPSFMANVKEPLYFFNDQTFHVRCLKQNKLGELATVYAEAFFEQVKPYNRKCIIGGNLIRDFENHVFIDLLTSEKNEFLHGFNFTHIDKRNLVGWQNREELINQLIKVYRGHTWQEVEGGNYLFNLIEQLS